MNSSLDCFKKVIVLAPHTDDGEFGCGACLARLRKVGAEVHYIAFSTADESVTEGFPSDVLNHEVKKATDVLGIDPQRLHILNFPVRRFNEHRQDILEYMVKMSRSLKPDLVFMPSLNDIHQDHAVISQEAVRAFKNTTILGYEILWNNLKRSNQCYVSISPDDLKEKIAAISCYESQKHRHYMNEDCITSLARVRGAQIADKYAELYEVVRWVIT